MTLDFLPLIVPVENGRLPGENIKLAAKEFSLYPVLDGADDAVCRAWENLGGKVLRHHLSLGLGRCVKTGLNAVLQDAGENFPGAVIVCGDAEPEELREAFRILADKPDTVCAGFADGDRIPGKWKNRLFRTLTGILGGREKRASADVTYVGLPASFCGRAVTAGTDGSNYFPELLLGLRRQGLNLCCLKTEGLPWKSVRIRPWEWLRMAAAATSFVLTSAASFLTDYGLFALLFYAGGLGRSACAVLARIVSSAVNFTLNRTLVFHVEGRSGSLWREIVQYYLLVGLVLAANIALLALFNGVLKIPVMLSKLIAEVILFVINYFVQRDLIFRDRK